MKTAAAAMLLMALVQSPVHAAGEKTFNGFRVYRSKNECSGGAWGENDGSKTYTFGDCVQIGTNWFTMTEDYKFTHWRHAECPTGQCDCANPYTPTFQLDVPAEPACNKCFGGALSIEILGNADGACPLFDVEEKGPIATAKLEQAAIDSDIFALIALHYESPATNVLSTEQLAAVHKALDKSLKRQAEGKSGRRLKLFIKLGIISKRRLLESGTVDITIIPAAGDDALPTTETGIADLKNDLADLVLDPAIESDLQAEGGMDGFSFAPDDNVYY